MFFNKSNKEIDEFAQNHGYKGAKYIGNWKEYKVYEPYIDNNQISYTGLPLVILVNDNGEIRMSTPDEAMATLDDKSFIKSFEDTKNDNKIDSNVINEVVSNIDEQIKKLESQKDNNFTKTSSIHEKEVDQQNEKNLFDVRNFSILNKTEEELYLAKKRFINDWYDLLTTQLDENWVMNSSTYRVHIQSIVEAILRRTNDEISKKELEYLQQANEYILNKNRVVLIKIVVDMKTLENK